MNDRPACLVVADALTPDERRQIENRWGAINPHYAGAPTADILDILYDSDANLEVREALWEEHHELWRMLPASVTSMIVIAAVWLDADERELLERIREIQQRVQL